MYRCSLCRAVAQPRQPKLRHVVYRTKREVRGNDAYYRKEIEQEVDVCAECKQMLDDGASVFEVRKARAPEPPVIVPVEWSPEVVA